MSKRTVAPLDIPPDHLELARAWFKATMIREGSKKGLDEEAAWARFPGFREAVDALPDPSGFVFLAVQYRSAFGAAFHALGLPTPKFFDNV